MLYNSSYSTRLHDNSFGKFSIHRPCNSIKAFFLKDDEEKLKEVGKRRGEKRKKSNILLKNRVCSNHTQKIWFSYIGVMCTAG